jgi:glycosyltransferase involved in cell wall biosynthesis
MPESLRSENANSKVTISVVTATYNVAPLLPALIESLRRQSDCQFQWVVADGGSTDGTLEILKGVSDLNVVISVQSDFGIYDALNRALRMTSGDYYLVLGADDTLAADAIANYRRSAVETGADMVFARVRAGEQIRIPCAGKPWLRGHKAYVAEHAVATLIRRSLHDRFKYYSRRFPIAADQYFLKAACASPQTKWASASFVAGNYAVDGVSGADTAGALTEFFRVQLETESCRVLQCILFVLRLIRHLPTVVRNAASRSGI